MNLRELLAKLAKLKTEGTELLDLAARENRDFTADEEKRFGEIEAEIKDLEPKIEQAKKMAERRANMHVESSVTATGQALPGLPGSAYEFENGNIEVGQDRTRLDPTCGFSSMTEFALAVRNASSGAANFHIDDRLNAMYAAPSNFHRETASEDGYMVPPEYRDRIWQLVHQMDDLFSMVDDEPTSKNVISDLRDETTPWDTTGVTAYWRSEASQMTRSRDDGKKPRVVQLHELYAFVEASDELLSDAPRMQNRLTVKASEAISWKRDEAIVYGNGVGKPEGYFESNALITQTKESGQSADTFTAMNAAKMYSRMLSQGIGRAIWLVNSDVLPQLMTMTIGDRVIWTPPSEGFKQAPGGFLLGRPIKLSEQAKTLGDKGDIQFIDLKGYYAPVKSGGVKFASSIHLWFDYGLQAFRWTFRMGGMPHMSAPVSPKYGSNTKSHFVTLAERA